MLYKITNLLSTSLTVEDLGILLPAKGSCTVRADSWAQSNDARSLEAKRWVRADKQYVQGQPPPSVVSVHRPPPAMVPQDPPPPVSQSRIDTPAVSGVPVSQESFDRFLKNQEELMRMMTGLAGAVPAGMDQINKSIQAMPAPAVVPYRPGSVQAHEYSPSARGADPMFIPTKIVPDDAQANIKVQEGEVQTDVGSSVDALRKMRKKP
jgi:hypothetical protein